MRTLTSWVVMLAGVAILLIPVPRLRAEQRRPPRLSELLDLYDTGKYSDAISAVELMSDDAGVEMRKLWFTEGRKWIDAKPPDHKRRLLVAAAFALEVEHVRVERGQWGRGFWQKTKNGGHGCSGKCVLDWAGQCLLERGTPDEAERAWWRAAIALVQGVRSTWSLYANPVVPAGNFAAAMAGQLLTQPPAGLVVSALGRFPDDGQFKLARAVALASDYDVTTDGGPRSPAVNYDVAWHTTGNTATVTMAQGERQSGITVRAVGGNVTLRTPNVAQENRRRYSALGSVIAEFAALTTDPVVGVEAHVRLGYLYWATGDDAHARTELNAAASAAVDPDLRYLAQFLIGVVARSANDRDAAAAAFSAALDVRPGAQSASLALAAIELQGGHGSRAYELSERAIDTGQGDADPWRLFLYGHYPQWPTLHASLREQVAR